MDAKDLTRQHKISNHINHDPALYRICAGLKQLKLGGMSDKDIEAQIRALDLPLKIHCFVLGNYTDIMSLKYRPIG